MLPWQCLQEQGERVTPRGERCWKHTPPTSSSAHTWCYTVPLDTPWSCLRHPEQCPTVFPFLAETLFLSRSAIYLHCMKCHALWEKPGPAHIHTRNDNPLVMLTLQQPQSLAAARDSLSFSSTELALGKYLSQQATDRQ